MINVIVWAIASLLIYAGLKALSAKAEGVPFEDGLSDDSSISEKEAILVACLAPLGTLFAIASVLYLFFDWKTNPFEVIVQAVTKWVKEFFGIVDAVKGDPDEFLTDDEEV
jgi:threonine/homoserine/homoserine lactone efflux protein